MVAPPPWDPPSLSGYGRGVSASSGTPRRGCCRLREEEGGRKEACDRPPPPPPPSALCTLPPPAGEEYAEDNVRTGDTRPTWPSNR